MVITVARLACSLLLLLAALSANAQQVLFVDYGDIHRGLVEDAPALNAVLANLGALPNEGAPTVVFLRSIDSSDDDQFGTAERNRARVELAAQITEELGAPAPVFVAGPSGREEDRRVIGAAMGRDPTYFPVTSDELAAVGYEWLIEPLGFELLWDMEGAAAELTAMRQKVFGQEIISPIDIVLCVDESGVVGWARSFRDFEATDASIGRFTRDCVAGRTEFTSSYVMPADLLADFELTGRWFALYLPDAHNVITPLDATEQAAIAGLELASVNVPLVIAATRTVTADSLEFVSAADHVSDLADVGVVVNPEFSERLPDWVAGIARQMRTTILIIFDENGVMAGYLGATPSNGPSWPTLPQVLLRLGLY
ncbi:MAG: hypothetical protein WDA03_06710 [Trueperaceae bacterium]